MKTNLNRLFLILIALTVISSCRNSETNQYKMSIHKEVFGEVNGKIVYLFTLTNTDGVEMKITNYGGIVTSLSVPDSKGNFEDIVLGFDNLQPYLDGHPYFGAIVGRYGNRIANGEFTIDGIDYKLATNNGVNSLHGGIKGFDKVLWTPKSIKKEHSVGLKLTYLSKDGEEGYPGNLKVTVKYSLTDNNEFVIDYEAETDKKTPVNITHHSYFNLKGAGNGDILDHNMRINADAYAVVNDVLIPTGELHSVAGTPFDFREPFVIGERMADVEGGYDHTFVLNNNNNLKKIITVSEDKSGRIMEVFTSEPGVQFYSGNFLDGSITGKQGKVYNKHYGFCLETQHFPDSPNQPEFPNTILKPGEVYKYRTVYKFSVD